MNARTNPPLLTSHNLIEAAFRGTLDGNPRLLPIEQAIVSSRPDCNEALELLDAITAALKLRYGETGMDEVFHEAKQLRDALSKADDALRGL